MSPLEQQSKGTIMLASLQTCFTGGMPCGARCLCDSPRFQGGGGGCKLAVEPVSAIPSGLDAEMGGGSVVEGWCCDRGLSPLSPMRLHLSLCCWVKVLTHRF